MKIKLLSQASVIVELGGVRVLTDPWFHGKAFNDSWSLFPPSAYREEDLEGVEYLWISHEHPDHFHPPTLRGLPERFKRSVTVLFQRNNSDKLFRALEKFGYKNFRALPHRRMVALSPRASVYCYQVGIMDSALAISGDEGRVLNINDAELTAADSRRILRDLGPPDVLLNQFSLAGYIGHEDRERHLAPKYILDQMLLAHQALKARATLPFASFVSFCVEDNAYMNDHRNRIEDVARAFEDAGQELVILYPGDELDGAQEHDSGPARARFREAEEAIPRPIDRAERVELTAIKEAFHERVAHLRARFSGLVLRQLEPVTALIPDLDITVSFSIREDRIDEAPGAAPAITVYSQPLWYVFARPWGLQTLGVSARVVLHKSDRNWLWHRVLFALDNAELYVSARHLLSRKNLRFAWSRARGGVGQALHHLRMIRGK